MSRAGGAASCFSRLCGARGVAPCSANVASVGTPREPSARPGGAAREVAGYSANAASMGAPREPSARPEGLRVLLGRRLGARGIARAWAHLASGGCVLLAVWLGARGVTARSANGASMGAGREQYAQGTRGSQISLGRWPGARRIARAWAHRTSTRAQREHATRAPATNTAPPRTAPHTRRAATAREWPWRASACPCSRAGLRRPGSAPDRA